MGSISGRGREGGEVDRRGQLLFVHKLKLIMSGAVGEGTGSRLGRGLCQLKRLSRARLSLCWPPALASALSPCIHLSGTALGAWGWVVVRGSAVEETLAPSECSVLRAAARRRRGLCLLEP